MAGLRAKPVARHGRQLEHRMNSAFVAYVADWEVKNVAKGDRVDSPFWFTALEYSFLVFFFCEIVLRLCVHKSYFLVNEDMKWNIFDLGLVLISVVDAVVSLVGSNGSLSSNEDGDKNVSFMRLLRLLKIAKILRAFRLMKIFRELTTILESFRRSFISLFWSLVMLVFLLYVFAQLFLLGVASFIEEHLDDNSDDTAVLMESFGSLTGSMLSLYMAVTGGDDWSNFYNAIVVAGPLYAASFVFFTFFFTFALVNILTGIFVEKAVVAATPDREDLVLQQRRKILAEAQDFRKLCTHLDEHEEGCFDLQTFKNHMANETMIAYMASVGLEVDDVELFFRVVAGDKDVVDIDTFVEGCMSMKGAATSLDVQKQLHEVNKLAKQIGQAGKRTDQKMDQLLQLSQACFKNSKGALAMSAGLAGHVAGPANAEEKTNSQALQRSATAPVGTSSGPSSGPKNDGSTEEVNVCAATPQSDGPPMLDRQHGTPTGAALSPASRSNATRKAVRSEVECSPASWETCLQQCGRSFSVSATPRRSSVSKRRASAAKAAARRSSPRSSPLE